MWSTESFSSISNTYNFKIFKCALFYLIFTILGGVYYYYVHFINEVF